MNIFLIRHGQTLLNQSNTHQYSTTPLSEQGVLEAKSVARRLKEAKIDIIYSSPLLRAKQTADEIVKSLGKTIVFLDELREIKRPTTVEGKSHEDPIVKEINRWIKENYANKGWHHSNEENFWDVRLRVEQLMQRIQNGSADNVLFVSHGIIIKMFLCLCIFKKQLTTDEFLAFYDNVHISNTGVTHCQFLTQIGWKVVRVNDTTQLTGN